MPAITQQNGRWSGRGSRHERGYGAAWVKLRGIVMERDGWLCQPCQRNGRVTEAAEVDHVLPKAKGGDDDIDNLQAICTDCHKAKTMTDEGKRPRRRLGLDGWPV
jgi:5-methylcytosine-specific restriction enzyme A